MISLIGRCNLQLRDTAVIFSTTESEFFSAVLKLGLLNWQMQKPAKARRDRSAMNLYRFECDQI